MPAGSSSSHAGPLANFSLSGAKLATLLEQHLPLYRAAAPFPHTVIEDLFSATALRAVAHEIPEKMLGTGCVPGAAACYRRRGTHFRKSELHDSAMGPHTRSVFEALRSRRFVAFLEKLSGINGLIPDPGFQGSGVHLTGRDGVLAVHHDFNFMLCKRLADGGGGGRSAPLYGECTRGLSEQAADQHRLHRRVNVFVYLNENWRESYGGHLELWNRNMSACERRIAPNFGRFVAFSSSDFSFHGHPQPMSRLPQHRMRRSIAFYYYTDVGRPVDECDGGDCVAFHDARWQTPNGCTECQTCGTEVKKKF